MSLSFLVDIWFIENLLLNDRLLGLYLRVGYIITDWDWWLAVGGSRLSYCLAIDDWGGLGCHDWTLDVGRLDHIVGGAVLDGLDRTVVSHLGGLVDGDSGWRGCIGVCKADSLAAFGWGYPFYGSALDNGSGGRLWIAILPLVLWGLSWGFDVEGPGVAGDEFGRTCISVHVKSLSNKNYLTVIQEAQRLRSSNSTG